MDFIRRNWSIITPAAILCAGVGANRAEMHNVHQDIEQIQGLRPEAVAAAVSQSQQDIRDLKPIIGKIGDDTGYSRGKLDSLDARLNEFNSRLQSLESRVK